MTNKKNSTQNVKEQIDDPLKIQGCGPVSLFIIITFWAVLLSVVDIFANWTIEQSLFESSTVVPDVRWIVQGIIGFILFITFFLAQLLTKTPRLKIYFKFWMLASILSLVMVPVKRLFITDQQATASFQVVILLLFCAVLFFIDQKRVAPVDEKKKRSHTLGIAVLIGAGMSIPWAIWGALGSLDDTLIYLILGEMFAVFTVEVFYPYLFDKTQPAERDLSTFDYLLDGLAIIIFFVIAITGLAQNGSQILISILLPSCALVIVGIAAISKNSSDRGKVSVGIITGLGLILPLLWFDADELSLITNSTPGETLEWALKAAGTSMAVILLAGILVTLFYKSFEQIHFSQKVNILLATISLAVLAGVYFLFGIPGFYGDKIFVVLKNQADLTQVNQIEDLSTRKQAVYQTLVKEADSTQTDLRTQLDKWRLNYTPYYLVNGIEVDAGPFYSMMIQKRSDVDRVLPSPQLRPLHKAAPVTNSNPVDKPAAMSWNLKMIGIDKVRIDLGITGKGIVIGQTDTGVDGYHPQVKSSYRGSSGEDDYNWLDPWNKSVYPTDAEGHGTATLGLITGKDIGIAPDAEWIGCVNLARNLGNPGVYLNCMQFMLAPYPQKGNAFTDGETSKGAMIVNNSWGCPQVEGCDAKIFQSAVDAMQSAGIFMSVAAGNTGNYGCSTVSDPPSIYSDVFTAGSINESGEISSFSSLGPVNVDGSDRVKPDILAPGEGVVSSFPNNAYIQADGTSFSAPHVSGVVALMWSANPKLIGNVELTRKILEETAAPYTGTLPACVTSSSTPNDGAGYGVLDAYAAVKAAIEVK
jgi:subtilisin family serine protease